MMKNSENIDSMDSWREENGFNPSRPHYAGGSEEDSTAKAIIAHEKANRIAKEKFERYLGECARAEMEAEKREERLSNKQNLNQSKDDSPQQ